MTSDLVSQLHDLNFFREAFENICPEVVQLASYLQTELIRLGLRTALTLLYTDLCDAQFWKYFDNSWIQFYHLFITTTYGQQFVLRQARDDVPMLLILLRESDSFLDFFEMDLDESVARSALALASRMQPRHQLRLLPFLRRSDPERFVATLCGIDFGALCAGDQVALIAALR